MWFSLLRAEQIISRIPLISKIYNFILLLGIVIYLLYIDAYKNKHYLIYKMISLEIMNQIIKKINFITDFKILSYKIYYFYFYKINLWILYAF